MRSTESLKQFFGGYFHQDCLLDDPNWEAIVQRYREDEGETTACVIAGEIRALVAESTSEEALATHLFQELGCYYSPRPDIGGPIFSAWLGSVCAELEK
jgi:hypothetical protein